MQGIGNIGPILTSLNKLKNERETQFLENCQRLHRLSSVKNFIIACYIRATSMQISLRNIYKHQLGVSEMINYEEKISVTTESDTLVREQLNAVCTIRDANITNIRRIIDYINTHCQIKKSEIFTNIIESIRPDIQHIAQTERHAIEAHFELIYMMEEQDGGEKKYHKYKLKYLKLKNH
jgi:hypothetical protein